SSRAKNNLAAEAMAPIPDLHRPWRVSPLLQEPVRGEGHEPRRSCVAARIAVRSLANSESAPAPAGREASQPKLGGLVRPPAPTPLGRKAPIFLRLVREPAQRTRTAS